MIIKNFNELARSRLWVDALSIIEEGLIRADPINAIKNNVRVYGKTICFRDLCINLEKCVHVVGFGKASYKMLEGILGVLGLDKICGGVIITHNPEWVGRKGPVEIVLGDHPIPKMNTLKASRRLLSYLKEGVSRDDLVVTLISGGGSALFENPMPPITMDDLSTLNDLLLKSGADIGEINTVRKHVSQVKGGRLAKIIYPARLVSLIISDVVGDPIDVIASGPTAPDPTTFRDAYQVLKRRGLWERVPESIRMVINNGLKGNIEESPKPGDKVFTKVHNIIIASNILSLRAMAEKAKSLGYNPVILTSMMEGEARDVAKFLAGIVKHVLSYGWVKDRPLAILLGGETTVTVKGKGIGGRNQELALAFSIYAKGLKDVVLASIGSDGRDGISDAAGAIVDGNTYYEAEKAGLDPIEFLERNDSYTILSKLGCTIYTGPTGTNVNDLAVILIR